MGENIYKNAKIVVIDDIEDGVSIGFPDIVEKQRKSIMEIARMKLIT